MLHYKKPIKKQSIDMFLNLLFSAHANHIIRLKGLVHIENETRPLLLHGVGGILEEPKFLDTWPDTDRSTRIVVFLENMEADFIERLFAGFIDIPMIDTPDKKALTDNPLAINGISTKFD